MKIDKILWILLLINLCIAVIAHWPTVCKVLVIINAIALLVCIICILVKGERNNG